MSHPQVLHSPASREYRKTQHESRNVARSVRLPRPPNAPAVSRHEWMILSMKGSTSPSDICAQGARGRGIRVLWFRIFNSYTPHSLSEGSLLTHHNTPPSLVALASLISNTYLVYTLHHNTHTPHVGRGAWDIPAERRGLFGWGRKRIYEWKCARTVCRD